MKDKNLKKDSPDNLGRMLKLRALDVLQGVRSLPLDLEVFAKSKSSRRSSISRRDVRNTSRLASANLADTFAHDLIDELLSASGRNVTTSRFVLLHNCSELCNSTLPLIDEFSIKAPCCMSDLYQFPLKFLMGLPEYNDVTKINEFSVKESVRPVSSMSTSTPKHKPPFGHVRNVSREPHHQRGSPYAASSSASSQTAEHHETPLGPKNSTQGNAVKVESRPVTTRTSTQNEMRCDGDKNEPQKSASKGKRRGRSIFMANKTESSFDFAKFLNLEACDSLSVFPAHRSYDENLFIETDFKKDPRLLFESSSSNEKAITFEDKTQNEKMSSWESVIRHPSYFSDDSELNRSDVKVETKSPEKYNLLSNSESLSSVFAVEVTEIIENEENDVIDRTQNNVETQTEASYLSTRSSIDTQSLAMSGRCSNCSISSSRSHVTIGGISC